MHIMRSNAKQKQRPVTFSGCWTCKERKVKCDENPDGCKQCARIGEKCGGYNIRLQWVSSSTEKGSVKSRSQGFGRRKIKQGPILSFNLDQIDRFLESLENDTANGVLCAYGPFTAFPSGSSSNASSPSSSQVSDITSETQRINNIVGDIDGVSNWNTQLKALQLLFPRLSLHDQIRVTNYIHLQLVVSSFVESSEEAVQRQQFNPWEQFPPQLATRLSDVNTSLCPQPQFFLLEGPKTNALFDYYSTRVAHVLQPLSHPGNPYQSIYVPLAIQGASEIRQFATMVAPCVKLCTFHAIIATAAFHMHGSDLSGGSEYYKIGSLHRQMALKCMQLALLDETLQSNYQLFMTAMMSLLTIGVMEGQILDFHVHIQAMIELRKSRRDWKILSYKTRQLNDMSRFLILLSRTTSNSLPAPLTIDPPTQYSLTPIPKSPLPPPCFSYIYGITADIAQTIDETFTLRTQLTPFLTAQQPIPESLAEAVEHLGNKLLAWTLDEELAQSIFPDDVSMQMIFAHHAQAWHGAAYLYYMHCIQGSKTTELMDSVARVAEHMHAAEDLKLLIPDRAPMAPITWPAFVASCCAVRRETWVEWWGRVQFYRIGSLQRQFEVVRSVWEEMDADSGVGDSWLHVLVRRGIEVLAL